MGERDLNELRRRKLGFIFQSFGLLPLLSAQENVELPLRIAGYKHGERAKRSRQVLEMVGLGRRAQHRPYELSGGEQQRVAIARALATDPSLMLADEPTGELDSATATAIFTLLREIARAEGITIVTCTHDRLVMEMASRIEELADGKLVTGQQQEVWRHVREKERSPFTATPAEGLAEPAPLSSLVGADMSQFRAPWAQQGAPAPRSAPETPADTEDTPKDDATVWARPKKP
jgi:putative ABC transport system ATP-binding protein